MRRPDMSIRDRIRQLRLYYKSSPLFREHLSAPLFAWLLPLLPGNVGITVSMITGRTLCMKASSWPLLPSACRLDGIGAQFEFMEDAKRIVVDGLTLYSPLWSREEANYYKEVLLDDVYGLKGKDLSGKIVVDVGAYVGDSSLAFARQGALVHAFEPSVTYCGFIRRNLAANAFGSRVVLHEVGLSERAGEITGRNDHLRFVEGIAYTIAQLPFGIDLLKLDCEGAEYHLLADPRFLNHLRPLEIRMEYHRGPDLVEGYLARAGYSVDFASRSSPVGLLTAQRMS
jgi:hypothetical protein